MNENLIIKKLMPDLADDFLDFFDNRAFTDNPEWKECYCCFDRVADDAVWERNSGAENRQMAEALIKNNLMHGFLAYNSNKVVGWCSADDLQALPRLEKAFSGAGFDASGAMAVSCFLIEASHRRKGIASKLLNFAIHSAALDGYSQILARPKLDHLPLQRKYDQENYHGPFQLFEKAGFSRIDNDDSFVLMRKLI